MYAKRNKAKSKISRASGHPKASEIDGPANEKHLNRSKENRGLNDNRPMPVIQGKITNIAQLKNGSHNRKQYIKIRSYVTQNPTTQANTTHTVNEDHYLGLIKGHPGFTNWDAFATDFVQRNYDLGGDTLVSVDYKTFSRK